MSCGPSTAVLTRVAIIIWGIAVLAALAGLGLLVLSDWQINFGHLISAFAAIGSTGGALIALWIATRDREERKQERDTADYAQAKLVAVFTHAHPTQTQPPGLRT